MKLQTYSAADIKAVIDDYNDMFGSWAYSEELIWGHVTARSLDGLRSEWWGMRDTTEPCTDPDSEFEEWCDENDWIQYGDDPSLVCQRDEVAAVLDGLTAEVDERQSRIDYEDEQEIIRESYR